MIKKKLRESNTLEVLQMEVGSYGNNVYLIRDRIQSCCVLIDAAAEGEGLLQAVGNDRLLAILLTHAHMDHVQALEGIRKKKGAQVGIHPEEPGAAGIRPEISLFDGQRIAVGTHELEVLHTPGHTAGSVSFLLRPDLCFCGDTVFPGGPGKTWSPEDFKNIIQTLERKIYTLPEGVQLLPGHGPGISVGDSSREYEIFRRQPRTQTPWGDVLWKEETI